MTEKRSARTHDRYLDQKRMEELSDKRGRLVQEYPTLEPPESDNRPLHQGLVDRSSQVSSERALAFKFQVFSTFLRTPLDHPTAHEFANMCGIYQLRPAI